MSTPASPPPVDLAALRADIDRIDAAMHALLMERGAIIDTLIAVKGTTASGSAFRPGREAAMMRAIAERHRGRLPLDTVEGIWRVIIATFTYVQAPFAVHADVSGGDAPMRDSARFHFGFTVPYRPHPGAGAVIAAVAASRGDLGIFRLDQGASAGAWWEALAGEGRPKVIARLPFIERPDHPAATPVYVVAKPLDDPSAAQRDLVLHLARVTRWREAAGEGVRAAGGEVVGSVASARGGLSLLLAMPGAVEAETLRDLLSRADAPPVSLAEVGSHAARFQAGAVPAR